MILGPNSTWPEARNHCKILCFLRIFGFSMFGCWKAFGLIFGWIWRWFWAPSWSQNRPKITQKGSKKQDVILNRFWMALGPILGGFGRQVGSQVEANMAPKSEKWGTKKRSRTL